MFQKKQFGLRTFFFNFLNMPVNVVIFKKYLNLKKKINLFGEEVFVTKTKNKWLLDSIVYKKILVFTNSFLFTKPIGSKTNKKRINPTKTFLKSRFMFRLLLLRRNILKKQLLKSRYFYLFLTKTKALKKLFFFMSNLTVCTKKRSYFLRLCTKKLTSNFSYLLTKIRRKFSFFKQKKIASFFLLANSKKQEYSLTMFNIFFLRQNLYKKFKFSYLKRALFYLKFLNLSFFTKYRFLFYKFFYNLFFVASVNFVSETAQSSASIFKFFFNLKFNEVKKNYFKKFLNNSTSFLLHPLQSEIKNLVNKDFLFIKFLKASFNYLSLYYKRYIGLFFIYFSWQSLLACTLKKDLNFLFNLQNLALYFVKLSYRTITPMIIGKIISKKLRARDSLLMSIKPFLNFVAGNGAIFSGITLVCSGRFTKRQRASYSFYKVGSVKFSNISKNILYSNTEVRLKYGMCNIKIWLHRK
jgi:hypothetical protein